MFVEGEFLDTVIGMARLPDRDRYAPPPDGDTRLELSSLVRSATPGSPAPIARAGKRHVAFEVNDLQAAVDWMARMAMGWSAASAMTFSAERQRQERCTCAHVENWMLPAPSH
jgi:hypothetical protein